MSLITALKYLDSEHDSQLLKEERDRGKGRGRGRERETSAVKILATRGSTYPTWPLQCAG